MTDKNLGSYIKKKREAAGITVRDFAKRIGISGSTLYNREGGSYKFRYIEIQKAAEVLHFQIEEWMKEQMIEVPESIPGVARVSSQDLHIEEEVALYAEFLRQRGQERNIVQQESGAVLERVKKKIEEGYNPRGGILNIINQWAILSQAATNGRAGYEEVLLDTIALCFLELEMSLEVGTNK